VERLACNNGESETLMENKVRWVILKGLPSGDLDVENIYAPNIPKEECFLWVDMIQKLPKGCMWILVVDWNMVERNTEKFNFYYQLILQANKLA
jgi:hypothetical protein